MALCFPLNPKLVLLLHEAVLCSARTEKPRIDRAGVPEHTKLAQPHPQSSCLITRFIIFLEKGC